MSASLLILAAGLGTRFKGGIKQLTPVGTDGELLMEYSVADAVRAGFDKVIFIIRRDIKEQFEELIGSRLRKYSLLRPPTALWTSRIREATTVERHCR